jgi:carboxyl-terminal processing protease
VSKSRLAGVALSLLLVLSLFVVLPRLGAQEGPAPKPAEAQEKKDEKGPKEGKDGLYRPLGLFTEVLSLVRSNYVEPVEMKSLMSGAFSGMTDAMDPFSEYIPEGRMAAFRASEEAIRKGEVIDPGLILARRLGYPLIVTAIPGSPAAKAGLQSDDLIEKIDGRPVHQVPLWEVRSKLSGKTGAKATVLVVRDGKPRHRTLGLTLAAWTADKPSAQRVSGEMVIRVPDFGPGTAAALKALVAPFDRTKPLLLDLRGTASGECDEAARSAALFVAAGPLGDLKGRKVEGKKWTAEAGERIHESPIILMVDSGTGGAAELFAAALREEEKATSKALKKIRLVGEPTFGMGAISQVVPLSGGGALKLTVAKVRTASGRTLSPKGLEPDDRVYPVADDIRAGGPAPVDLILQRGLELLAKASDTTKSAS